MKKNYLLPRQNVVEIDEEEMLCTTSPGTETRSMKVKMNDYDTYTEPEDKSVNSVNWTGSDF